MTTPDLILVEVEASVDLDQLGMGDGWSAVSDNGGHLVAYRAPFAMEDCKLLVTSYDSDQAVGWMHGTDCARSRWLASRGSLDSIPECQRQAAGGVFDVLVIPDMPPPPEPGEPFKIWFGRFTEEERRARLTRALGPGVYEGTEKERAKSWDAEPGSPEWLLGQEADDAVVADEIRIQKEGISNFVRPAHRYEIEALKGLVKRDISRTEIQAIGIPFCHVKTFMVLKKGKWKVKGFGTTLYTTEHAKAAYDSYRERFPEKVDGP